MSAPIISSTFALVVLVLVVPSFALLYVDTHPLTPSSAAAVNGHLHVVQLAVQALLVIVISVIPQLVSMSIRSAGSHQHRRGCVARSSNLANAVLPPHYVS